MSLYNEAYANGLELSGGGYWPEDPPPSEAVQPVATTEAPETAIQTQAETLQQPRSLVIVSNDNAMNAGKARPALQTLYDTEDRWVTKSWIRTHPGLFADLDAHITNHTDLIIAGGDGTVGWVVEWLDSREDLEDIRIVLVGAGNKNDKAYELNGPDHLMDVQYILDNGYETTHYGIEALFGKGTPHERYVRAQYILGLAASARTAQDLDDQTFRGKQERRGKYKAPFGVLAKTFGEIRQTLGALQRSPAFRMRAVGNRTIKGTHTAKRYADLTVVAAARAAGGYMRTRTTSHSSTELAVQVSGSRVDQQIGGMAMLMSGRSPIYNGAVMVELLEPVPLHADGQLQQPAPAGTAVFRPGRGVVFWGVHGPERIVHHAATGDIPGQRRAEQMPYLARHALSELRPSAILTNDEKVAA